jgi:diaminobutyrate-2-oxoglutarate transaminase
MPEVSFAPYAYCHRCPLKLARPACGTACAAHFESLFEDSHSGVAKPAAAIVECVQGEGGSIVPPGDFVRRVREATRSASVVLIADEIQAGLGRTGRWFSFEHFDVEPDVVCVSKALGGIGLPISAILYKNELDVWEPGLHIGTFRGHQLAMAAGIAAIRVIRDEGLLENARVRGDHLRAALSKVGSPWVGEVRGLGLMLGVELRDPATGAPASAVAKQVRRACFERGLLCELGGRGDATIRLLPPLVLTEAEAEEGMAILCRALREIGARRSEPAVHA